MMKKGNKKPAVVIIGLDGATFAQIQPMIEEGKLPSLKKLIEGGTSGKLKSTFPPTTPPAWSTMLTGVNPGRHGIYDFRTTPHANPSRPLIHLGAMKSPKLWEILEKAGMKSGFMNVPIMYPPEQISGWMITGMMTPSKEVDFTYPQSLKKEIEENFPQYMIDVDIPRYDNLFWEDIEVFLNDLEKCTTLEKELFFYMWDRAEVDLLMAVFIVADRIGHLLWKYTDRNHSLSATPTGELVRQKVDKIYTILDEIISEALHRVAKTDGNIIVMSDHGFGATEGYFNVNRMLEEMGLLKIKRNYAMKKRIFYRAWQIGDNPIVTRLLPKSFQRKIRNRIRKRRSSFLNEVEPFLDMEATCAFYASIPCHGIFIRRHGQGGIIRDESEYKGLKEKIKKQLESIKTSDGQKLVTSIFDREEIYKGPMTKYAPDIVFSARNFAVIPRPLLGATEILTTTLNQPNGFHRMDGIVAIWGNGVEKTKVKDAQMSDIAPTVIKLLGLPMPPFFEGSAIC